MKSINYLLLRNELKKHKCSIKGEYNLENLFEAYAELEINSINDFLNKDINSEFYNFVRSNESLIEVNTDTPSRSLHTACLEITYYCLRPTHISYEKSLKHLQNFSKLITALTSEDQNILDVGSGRVPYSAIFTANNNRQVDAMDRIVLPDSLMEQFNVGKIKQYFDESTDISNYDLVAGSMPCSAIEPIVKKCTNDNKSYIIELCNCELPDRPKDIPEDTPYSWVTVLQDYDANIHSTGNFVYNIVGKSPKEVDSIIDSIYPSEVSFDCSDTMIRFKPDIDTNNTCKEMEK